MSGAETATATMWDVCVLVGGCAGNAGDGVVVSGVEVVTMEETRSKKWAAVGTHRKHHCPNRQAFLQWAPSRAAVQAWWLSLPSARQRQPVPMKLLKGQEQD